jgi:hypothetical protein
MAKECRSRNLIHYVIKNYAVFTKLVVIIALLLAFQAFSALVLLDPYPSKRYYVSVYQ